MIFLHLWGTGGILQTNLWYSEHFEANLSNKTPDIVFFAIKVKLGLVYLGKQY